MTETAIIDWGHKKPDSWALIGGSTMGTEQFEDEIFDDALSRSYEHPQQIKDVTMVVSCDLEGAKSDREYQCQPRKFYWRSKRLIDYFVNSWKNFVIYQGLEDYSGSQGDTIASFLTSTDVWSNDEHDEHVRRGVYTHTYKRKILFTKALEMKISELPRWKPSVIIGKRNFEEEDVQ